MEDDLVRLSIFDQTNPLVNPLAEKRKHVPFVFPSFNEGASNNRRTRYDFLARREGERERAEDGEDHAFHSMIELLVSIWREVVRGQHTRQLRTSLQYSSSVHR
jgi:hypothetical protein